MTADQGDAERTAEVEQAELNRRMVVKSAESTMADVRVGEPADLHRAACQRHRTAKD